MQKYHVGNIEIGKRSEIVSCQAPTGQSDHASLIGLLPLDAVTTTIKSSIPGSSNQRYVSQFITAPSSIILMSMSISSHMNFTY